MPISIRLVLKRGLFLLALLIPLAAAPPAKAACAPFALNSVSPGSAAGSDAVTLTGTGLCGGPESYFAWGFDGSRGFAIDVDGGTPDTTLTGSLLPTPVAVTAPMRLWRVQEVELADSVLQMPNGIYWLRDPGLYLFRQEATGPAFGALPGSGTSYTSQLVAGNLQLDFGTTGSTLRALPEKDLNAQPAPGDGSYITVWVVAETDDEEPKGEEPDPQNGPGPIRWLLRFDAVCFGAAPNCDDPVVAVTAAGLNQLAGPLRMQAHVNGSVLTLGHLDYELESGMVTVIDGL